MVSFCKFLRRGRVLQQENGNCEGAFRLLAVAYKRGRYGWPAGLGDVPWRARLWVLGVTHVGGGLGVDADGVEGDEGGMQ